MKPRVVKARPPFSLQVLCRVLQRFPYAFAERVSPEGSIERVMVTSTEPLVVELHSQIEDEIKITAEGDSLEVIREVFELDSDVRERLQRLPESRILGEAVALPILRWEESFSAMASTIIEQQNSWVSATRCIHTLFAHSRRRVGELSAFPEPQEILAHPEVVNNLAITNRRKALLFDLAETMSARPDYLDELCLDLNKAESCLVKLPGIGPWTARVFLSKRFGYRPEVPTNDVALQRAAAHFILGEDRKMDAQELLDHLAPFGVLGGEAAQRLLLRWVLETYPRNSKV